MIQEDLRLLASEMESELREDILPFWPRFVDRENGGFYGLVENDGRFDPHAGKGVVSQARFLWSYAAAARVLGDPSLLSTADAAYRFIKDKLFDRERKGFFWAVDYRGVPTDARKIVYGQAFAMYALAEYARSGGPRAALDLAWETFHLLQGVALDRRRGGYFEAVSADWSAAVSSTLSDADIECAKSMNTNLHVLEALSSLYAATGDSSVRDAIRSLVDVFLDRIFVSPAHLGLYFNADWSRLDNAVSLGHDIEASWLVAEAAGHAWDGPLPERVRVRVLCVAEECARVLRGCSGSLPNEEKDGRLDTDRIWWPQAEAIVGMVNAWEIGGDPACLGHARSVWDFVEKSIIDHDHGEWYWGVREDGTPLGDKPKGGFWKECYHNGRACMEIMTRGKERKGQSI
jgi:mannobiose 2-epimerase